jgi:glycosyltransferase involved in cell wall biosynthesis
MIPTVTFIVPCYKLAHLLKQCVESILGQTYRDFEVLIMDDCSPDNTPDIACSFDDTRVKHIRNNPNIGHLRNYNKGISLAQGKYIWLISADDYLRHPCILERYVSLLNKNPRVGYTCCPGVSVVNGEETNILSYSVYCESDRVVSGHVFLKRLLKSNIVLAASALVRRDCYERISMFPLSKGMEWAGDWYLWCLFALSWDVGYFAEPMVCYREHMLSMTRILKEQKSDILALGDTAVPWMIKEKADAAGFTSVSRLCLQSLVFIYTYLVVRKGCGLSRRQFEDSLNHNTLISSERGWIRAGVYTGIGDHHYWHGRFMAARIFYLASAAQGRLRAKVYLKMLLLACGKFGFMIRQEIRRWRKGGLMRRRVERAS